MEQNNTMSPEQAAEQIRKVLAPMPENRQFFLTSELEEALRVAVDCIEKVQRIPTEKKIEKGNPYDDDLFYSYAFECGQHHGFHAGTEWVIERAEGKK